MSSTHGFPLKALQHGWFANENRADQGAGARGMSIDMGID
jgi:hypothetical protein